jgi:hypothetical protein
MFEVEKLIVETTCLVDTIRCLSTDSTACRIVLDEFRGAVSTAEDKFGAGTAARILSSGTLSSRVEDENFFGNISALAVDFGDVKNALRIAGAAAIWIEDPHYLAAVKLLQEKTTWKLGLDIAKNKNIANRILSPGFVETVTSLYLACNKKLSAGAIEIACAGTARGLVGLVGKKIKNAHPDLCNKLLDIKPSK